MATFYFNTGVKPSTGSQLFGRQVWRGGVKQIPFQCDDVPEGSTFLFGSDRNDLDEASRDGIIVREILDSGPEGLLSKYAYFRLPLIKQKD